MKPSQPMMSAAQAARALGQKAFKRLVDVGAIHPTTDARGVVRVPIDEVERCLSRRELSKTPEAQLAPITIYSRKEFAEVKKLLPTGEAMLKAIDQRCADPRVDFVVALFIPDDAGGMQLNALVASRAGLRAAVQSACDFVLEKGLLPVLVVDPDGAEFTALNPPSPETFKNQFEETRAANRRRKERGNG